MSSGERPMGAAKGKQSDTEALCQTPPRLPSQYRDLAMCRQYDARQWLTCRRQRGAAEICCTNVRHVEGDLHACPQCATRRQAVLHCCAGRHHKGLTPCSSMCKNVASTV